MALLSSKTGIPLVTNQSAQSPIRAGTIEAFAGATTPAGWLDCDGSVVLQATYPELFAQIGAAWATCTNPLTGSAYSAPAAGSFRVPDLRGAFQRGAGTFSDGIGANTTLGGYQGDQSQGYSMLITAPTYAGFINNTSGAQGGNFTRDGVGTNNPAEGSNWRTVVPQSDGTNGTPRIGTENRPRNVGVKYIIKAWDESFNLAGFANATAGSNGLVAPRKGSYDLTPVGRVTSTLVAWVTTRAIGIYYQDQDGNHRFKFTIRGTCTAGTSGNFLISGVTFKNITDWHQTVTIQAVGSAPYTGAGAATPGTNSVNCYGSSSSSEWRVSGDVELESKPSWA